MTFRIAFSGTSGTGKTTTARLISAAVSFPQIVIMNPDARKVLSAQGHKNIQNVRGRDYVEFQKTYINTLLASESKNSCFLTERSSIDCLAFWNCFCLQDAFSIENVDYANVCISNARQYSHIFYFPFGVIPYENDGWRGEEPNFFSSVDKETRRIYAACCINFYEIASLDRHERRDEVLMELGLFQ